MNFYKLFLLSVNISLVFCLEPIQECKFLNAYSSYYLDDNGCCFSENVKCDISQGHIVSIDLRNSIKQDMRNKFSLEKFLNQFPSLKRINISENELTGDFIIPNNTTLVELNASNNSFNGKLVIPDNSEIDSFFNDGECRLQILNISNNEFKGDLNIPDNSTLVMLDASNNHFNGYLNIGENTELEELNVSNNEFKEEFLIPPHTNLKTL
ncbi:hypothetical protein LY90DRAFT_27451 [Neocallimastix californiae]|uniref:L domain-like protein n=1 Tax=Neocallimastix californiae TaxID=1754190 RepID=A0A1Y2C7F7_9FUNG|nr:hypothetical protein LY90DRAFT_27451 [Neocallimastix californiae]|eukprot:ORY42961.1 hypothetical protein LY90DRAFT_27451 [Neocallimastix californiae]